MSRLSQAVSLSSLGGTQTRRNLSKHFGQKHNNGDENVLSTVVIQAGIESLGGLRDRIRQAELSGNTVFGSAVKHWHSSDQAARWQMIGSGQQNNQSINSQQTHIERSALNVVLEKGLGFFMVPAACSVA
ncbi:hypothetical protein AJ80_02030 [Polytolypa hystricis UAMH7299]|uniref:Uncharacterized protein n=1 Tax=Polytolypa hystricis (strain UAMH7299) TaxID=1447883 RepID=A0A2B7YSU6_POLH7|nr:hypothetical protein AJ80_02030 [Polytolypa hystricis UAMH7299]